MRVLVQRVKEASVRVDGKIKGSIGFGMLVFLGIVDEDSRTDIEWLCKKISNLRIYNDENGVMNKSIMDIEGEFLVISQFTLHASTKKGNRPSYIRAAKPEVAIPLYEEFVSELNKVSSLKTEVGVFGADMKVLLLNDGPVTIMIDSKNKE